MLEARIDSLPGLLLQAEERLRSLMNVEIAKVTFQNEGSMFHVDKEGKLSQVDAKLGIMG